jgi:hypothetical protein
LFLHSDPLHTKELQAQATHELSNSLKWQDQTNTSE